MHRVGLVLLMMAGILSACSSGNGSATPTTAGGPNKGSPTTTTTGGSLKGSSTPTTTGGSLDGNTRPTTGHGSLNVSPCNYAQAWHDNQVQFSEFAVLARLAGQATNSSLRDDGRQLASALSAGNTAIVDEVAGNIFAVCRQLGLVRADGSAEHGNAR